MTPNNNQPQQAGKSRNFNEDIEADLSHNPTHMGAGGSPRSKELIEKQKVDEGVRAAEKRLTDGKVSTRDK